MTEKTEQQARQEILDLVAAYARTYKVAPMQQPYHEGERIPYASRVYDEKEMVNLVDSALEFWLTAGRYTEAFEQKFGEYLGVRYVSLVNSGSSANLLAFSTLTSPLLGERRVKRGDEVITVAAGFPTTVNPIIQYGAIPVFVDVTLPTCDIDVTKLEAAYSEKTKAVMIAHTLGNPFNLKAVKDFCDRHELWLVEDNCDALGSTYTIDGETRQTGSIGDIGTSSFYPPHHMTMGEGGACYTNNPQLHRIMRSIRDWGRDCWCAPGHDNTCHHRFDGQYGELPKGYDHKYVYSHFGYNLKATDMQAAIGVAQLEKFPGFVARRKHNFELLKAVGRLNKPVLLKRGLSSTLEELVMSAEYIMAEGNPNVVLCERGIRTFETSMRNTLDISAVPMLKKMTHLPVVIDPSHAAGIAFMVPALAKAAVAVGADGLMIETHNDPSKAKSDGAQSLTPDQFDDLMKTIKPELEFFGKKLN